MKLGLVSNSCTLCSCHVIDLASAFIFGFSLLVAGQQTSLVFAKSGQIVSLVSLNIDCPR